MKKTLFPLLLFCVCFSLHAQEQLSGLAANKLLCKKGTEAPSLQSRGEVQGRGGARFIYRNSLLLPFVEDFSYESPYADSTWWCDSTAFVNRSFGFRAPSWGCVTLDAVDAYGRVYAHASTAPFPADTLTSKPIRLDSVFSPIARKLTAADSVYFSFFYQPGGGLHNHPWEGLGDAPESGDSLILEFGYYTGDTVYLTADSTVSALQIQWKRVWASPGMDLEKFLQVGHLDTFLCFKQVMIAVTDSCFFNRGFCFRFRNMASLEYSSGNPTWAGNVDFWNIDYIRLDRGRTCRDTFVDDVTIASNPGGVLKNYEAMPWRQFTANELRNGFEVELLNLSDVTKNASYRYTVTDAQGQHLADYDGGAYNILNYRNGGFQTYAPHASPTLGNLNLSLSGPTDILVTHIHREAGAGDRRPANDTAVFVQRFDNYFAYDDGTPEAGYTVVDVNSKNTALALKFNLNAPDTLRAVGMYINHAYNEANQFDFTLCVWDCQQDMPGELLYSRTVSQHFLDELYGFQLFELEESLPVSGCFFVGYALEGTDYLNIGFDQNRNHSDAVRYYATHKWNHSFLAGTPMIRPYVGDPIPAAIGERGSDCLDIRVYPNPTEGQLHIQLPARTDATRCRMQLYDSFGQRIYQGAYTERMDISAYPAGMYVLLVQDGYRSYAAKVVKQ